MAKAQTTYTASWSSYVGGTYEVDAVYAVAADSATNSYLGGSLGSGEIQSDPSVSVTDPYYYQGAYDAFLAQVTATGTLGWYICLGNTENDRVLGLAVGPDNRILASGFSERTDLLNEDDGLDACLWAVDRATGSNLWAVSFGDIDTTNVLSAVAVDTNGYIYAAGYTSQTGLARNVSAYTLNGTNYGTQFQGGFDACVLKLSPAGEILWFRYLGGTNADAATALAVAPDGTVYVAGETRSPNWSSLPSGAPSPANPDGFLVKLTSDGAHVWSAFLGGSAADAVTALAKDPASAALFVGGATASSDFLSGATRLNSPAGGADGFALKLTDSGAAFQTNWCRFFGGATADGVSSLALKPAGSVAVGGSTTAGSWLTQTTGSAFAGVQDGFISQLTEAGGVEWSAYLGGAQADALYALAAAPNSLVAGGQTLSPGWVNNGFWTTWNKEDLWGVTGVFGFVARWSSEPGVPPAVTDDPDDLTVQEGQPAVFRAAATGTATLTYRWLRNGVPVTGLTSNTYVIAAAARTNNQDTYACLVSNYYGTAVSQAARLTVISNATLTVALAPAAAVAQGARWSLDGGATWYVSGTATNLPGGTYAVSFTNLTGWTAPAAFPVTLAAGASLTTSGVYAAVLPAAERAVSGTNVTVTVRAPAGLSTWTLVETLQAGLTPTSISGGGVWDGASRTLTFTGAEATTNAFAYTVSTVTSGVFTVSGIVTSHPSEVPVAVTGDNRIIKANLIRTISGNSVTITVYQPSSSFVWDVTESIPAGLTPTNMVGPNAAWDDVAREVSWYRKGVGVTLSYQVTGAPGTYTLSGYGHVTANDEPIFGDSVVTIQAPVIPAPDILSFYPSGTNVFTLSFTSVVNQAYVIVTNASLAHTNGWATYLPVTGSAGVTLQQVQRAATNLFYRVRVSP